MRRSLAPGILVLALTACSGARAVPITAPTPVRTWAGVALLSVRVGGLFRLATQQGAEPPRILPGIAASAEAFDADIGPGPAGSPVIVFTRCHARHGCRLMQTTVSGASETEIAGSAVRRGFERSPAVWGNRLVFARRPANRSVHVYVRPLDATGSRRPVMLPGPPAGRGAEVTGLSVRGPLVAETLSDYREGDECPSTEIRLLDIDTRRSRHIWSTGCGIGDETLTGGSVTSGHVLWAKTCPGDETACSFRYGEPLTYTQLYSYGLRDHLVEHVAESDVLLSFAAEDDGHAVEVMAPEEEGGGNCVNHSGAESQPPCQLLRTGPIPFAPVRRRPPIVSGSSFSELPGA